MVVACAAKNNVRGVQIEDGRSMCYINYIPATCCGYSLIATLMKQDRELQNKNASLNNGYNLGVVCSSWTEPISAGAGIIHAHLAIGYGH